VKIQSRFTIFSFKSIIKIQFDHLNLEKKYRRYLPLILIKFQLLILSLKYEISIKKYQNKTFIDFYLFDKHRN
jgi:hypothetical protein